MPHFRVPFLHPRRSFRRLRSFHLQSPEGKLTEVSNRDKPLSGPVKIFFEQDPVSVTQSNTPPLQRRMVLPLRGSTILILSLLASFLFIMSISFAFIGSEADGPPFIPTLNSLAKVSPGIVLIGEGVDVDINEPAVTIRWSIVACGPALMLNGTAGLYGTEACGFPAIFLRIYVDGSDVPSATYDPSQIPFGAESGQRRSIQNMVQFDSDHDLDVHEDRLYPFDTYKFSTTLRAVAADNKTIIPIQKLSTLNITTSFDIFTVDLESYSAFGNQTNAISRDIDIYISRPAEARFFALLLFFANWILTHVTIGHVVIARRLRGLRAVFPHLVSSGVILVAIPQLRNSMPDGPDLNGVLIDSIGYFPQMIIVSISTILLLIIIVSQEIDALQHGPRRAAVPPMASIAPLPPTRPTSHVTRPPSSPKASSTSTEIARWEMRRLVKQLRGDYVFPPVKPTHRLMPSETSTKTSHRRVKTMSKIMEAGEVSHWSDDGE